MKKWEKDFRGNKRMSFELKIKISNMSVYASNSPSTWVSLPMHEGDLVKKLNEMNIGDDDYIISDYESNLELSISEKANILNLNELAWVVSSLDSNQFKRLSAILEENVYTPQNTLLHINYAIEDIDKYILLEDVRTVKEAGRHYIYDVDDSRVSHYWKQYIDYERYGRDCLMYDDFLSEYGLMIKCG